MFTSLTQKNIMFNNKMNFVVQTFFAFDLIYTNIIMIYNNIFSGKLRKIDTHLSDIEKNEC